MTVKTVQLRRYDLPAEVVDEFLAWWRDLLVPAREAFGFSIEFAYLVPEKNEFVWATSVEGDRKQFEAVEAAWMASPERAEIFGDRKPWFSHADIDFVEVHR